MATTKAPAQYRVTVAGYGSFPIDMLRYDRATPATEADSGRIQRLLEHFGRRDNGLTTVTLIAPKDPTAGPVPSAGRWKSFGWTVTDVKPA